MITNEIEYITIDGVPYKKTTYYDEVEGGEKTEVASVTEPVQTPTPEPEPTELHLTREDFDLLDVTYSATTYHILEDDNTITIQRGEF